MTYFMDYGPNWPPPLDEPEPTRRKRRGWPLWKRAAARVLVLTVIWACGAVWLQARIDAQPIQGAETEVTTFVGPPPHPAKVHRHP